MLSTPSHAPASARFCHPTDPHRVIHARATAGQRERWLREMLRLHAPVVHGGRTRCHSRRPRACPPQILRPKAQPRATRGQNAQAGRDVSAQRRARAHRRSAARSAVPTLQTRRRLVRPDPTQPQAPVLLSNCRASPSTDPTSTRFEPGGKPEAALSRGDTYTCVPVFLTPQLLVGCHEMTVRNRYAATAPWPPGRKRLVTKTHGWGAVLRLLVCVWWWWWWWGSACVETQHPRADAGVGQDLVRSGRSRGPSRPTPLQRVLVVLFIRL